MIKYTLYIKKYNTEFYNIHKNGQTSILKVFDHKNKNNIDRIKWVNVDDLPKNRNVICIYRNIYDRCISSFLYLNKLTVTKSNVLNKFKKYLGILLTGKF